MKEMLTDVVYRRFCRLCIGVQEPNVSPFKGSSAGIESGAAIVGVALVVNAELLASLCQWAVVLMVNNQDLICPLGDKCFAQC